MDLAIIWLQGFQCNILKHLQHICMSYLYKIILSEHTMMAVQRHVSSIEPLTGMQMNFLLWIHTKRCQANLIFKL